MPDSYDSPWKEAIVSCLPDFVAFHFPDVHRQIDWTRPVEFLDQELRSVAPDHGPQSSFVDKLVRVTRLDGQQEWVVIHLEIQSQQQAAFAERMFLYHARLYERHRQPIASLALLADDKPAWRPESFGYEVFGCRMGLRFPVAKLLDWSGSEARLADSRNPFAIITRAHLATRATSDNPAAREHAKLMLIRQLYGIGIDRQRVVDMFRVIDWMMKLPQEHDTRFRHAVVLMEEELNMRYVTSIERLAIEEGMAKGMQQGIQQGMQQGMQQGEARLLARLLTQRFGELPSWVQDSLATATGAQLESWADTVLTSETLEQVFGRSGRH
jgi:hypothetical protein